ncbi:MAG: hypothetical protein RLZZ253_1668 [Verrucomicrobiota bacterium]|jgi:hypothetical protein
MKISTTSITPLVTGIVERTPVYDIHTHLYDPAFGQLLLWGIDELLTYHYLIAESFRAMPLSTDQFWALSKSRQAEVIWDALFLQNSPVSEACRGVLTTLQRLGLDVRRRDLKALRQHYASWKTEDFVTKVLEVSGVRKVCMTNSPFDDLERPVWEAGFQRDPRFVAALRIDPLLLDWPNTVPKLRQWGYDVATDFSGKTFSEVRRFLADWTRKIDSQYCMVSLSPDFEFPGTGPTARLIEEVIMPHGREHNQAFALMIGVKRNVNPQLRLAGDSVGGSDVGAVERLCAAYPDNKFLCTLLAREDQHALCVAARKFRNLHVFGCWWFMNNPSLIEEVTRMRLEMIGLTMTPQHSDCRVMDQLVYKWAHSKPILARVLSEKYEDLAATGWEPSENEIQRDVHRLLGGALEEFLAL